jgi:hypothetical protein
VSTLSYSAPPGVAAPPPRKVYALPDPVAHAATDLAEAAEAILARYGACQWRAADAHTDDLQGRPAQAGEAVRAVADSGFGSEPANPMDMLCWVNLDTAASGPWQPPVLRWVGGRPATEHTARTWGLWCKKTLPQPGVMPRPRNRVPYDLEDAHFALIALSPLGAGNGVAFQASQAEARQVSEIRLLRGQPQLRFVDARGQVLRLTSPARLLPRQPAVITLTSAAGAQRLRVNAEAVAASAATFAPSTFTQMLIGWGFVDHVPDDSLEGLVFAAVAGRGAPSLAELEVLERHLARLAGFTL